MTTGCSRHVPARRRPGRPRDDVPCRPRSLARSRRVLATRVPEILGQPGLAVRGAQGTVGRVPCPPGRGPGAARAAVEAAIADVDREFTAARSGPLPRTAGGRPAAADGGRKREAFEASSPSFGRPRSWPSAMTSATPTGSRCCAPRGRRLARWPRCGGDRPARDAGRSPGRGGRPPRLADRCGRALSALATALEREAKRPRGPVGAIAPGLDPVDPPQDHGRQRPPHTMTAVTTQNRWPRRRQGRCRPRSSRRSRPPPRCRPGSPSRRSAAS